MAHCRFVKNPRILEDTFFWYPDKKYFLGPCRPRPGGGCHQEEPGGLGGLPAPGDKVYPPGGRVSRWMARTGGGRDPETGGRTSQTDWPGGERSPVPSVSAAKCFVGERELCTLCKSHTGEQPR